MAGDLEDALADAFADVVVRVARVPGGLRKAGASALRKQARAAGREVAGDVVTPVRVRLASLTERIEFLEAQRRELAAGYGGGRG